MKIALHIVFIIFCYASTSCSKVLYESPMPIGGEQVYDFPSSFIGEYLNLQYTPNSVDGTFKEIYKESKQRYFIEEQVAIKIDSLSWTNRGLGLIQDIIVKEDRLKIVTGVNTLNWFYHETIINKTPDFFL